jgi:20S proteasome alpha/beta subunit
MTHTHAFLCMRMCVLQAAFVLGGVDATGAHLYALHPHGSSDEGPFAALGSGSMAALSVLESGECEMNTFAAIYGLLAEYRGMYMCNTVYNSSVLQQR